MRNQLTTFAVRHTGLFLVLVLVGGHPVCGQSCRAGPPPGQRTIAFPDLQPCLPTGVPQPLGGPTSRPRPPGPECRLRCDFEDVEATQYRSRCEYFCLPCLRLRHGDGHGAVPADLQSAGRGPTCGPAGSSVPADRKGCLSCFEVICGKPRIRKKLYRREVQCGKMAIYKCEVRFPCGGVCEGDCEDRLQSTRDGPTVDRP